MAVGYPQAKADIDARAGSLCLQLRDLLNSIQNFETFLSTQTTTTLQTLGYSSGEATTLLANFGVLVQLRNVFYGTQAIPTAVDVSQYIKPFLGVN